MKALGCPTNMKGNCWGVAVSAEIARSNSLYLEFRKTINYLAGISGTTLLTKVNEASQKSTESPETLNSNDKILLTIRELFAQIYNYQEPFTLQHKLGVPGPHIQQNDLKKTNALVRKAKEHTTFVTSDHYKQFLLFSKKEDNWLKLIKCLKIIKASPLEVGFLLSSKRHAVHLFYNKIDGYWNLTSDYTRTWPIRDYKKTSALVESLMNNEFGGSSNAVFCFTVFLDESKENTVLTNALDAVSKDLLETINSGQMPDFTDSYGRTLLHIASYNGFTDIVEALLGQPSSHINKTANNNTSPLFIAAYNGNLSVVEALLKQADIEVNIASETGETALFAAAENGHVEVVDALRRHPKIDIQKSNIHGDTPVKVAMLNKHQAVWKLLCTPLETTQEETLNPAPIATFDTDLPVDEQSDSNDNSSYCQVFFRKRRKIDGSFKPTESSLITSNGN